MLARRLTSAVLAISFLGIMPSLAQDLDEKLTQISSRLDAANGSFLSGGGMSMQELSKLAIELESILKEMRQVEREFGAKREEVEDQFKDESEELSKVLGYMATLQSVSAPDYFLHPEGPIGSIHANILVEAVLPQLEGRLNDIAKDLRFWRDIHSKQNRLSDSAVEAVGAINIVRKELVEMDRNDAPKRVVQEPAVLDALFAVSDNLSDFVRGMETLPVGGDPAPSFDINAHKGELSWPAEGERTEHRQGIVIKTSQSVISTPISGTVRFAKDFLDYGNLLIIEVSKGYLIVLSGFDELLAKEGDILETGDILGFFAIEKAETSENSLVNEKNELYVEIRENGAPVDVTEYFVSDAQ